METEPLVGCVVFHQRGGWWLDRWQDKNIRHCFAVVVSGDVLLRLDGEAGSLVNECVGQAGELDALQRMYTVELGWIVVPFWALRAPVKWPMCWATCVGMTKLVLGLNRPLILTPYQLHRYLTKTLGLEVYKPT